MTVGELLRIISEISQAEQAMAMIVQPTGNPQLDMVARLDPRVVQLRAYVDKLRAIPLDYVTPQPPEGASNGEEVPAQGG